MIALAISVFLFAAPPAAGNAKTGKVVYERYCLSCHGPHGDGNGESAAWMTPKPRDFRQGTFKCRSTPSGQLPLLSDLDRTITNGIHGTNMPTWFAIGARNRRDALAYVQTFSPRWTTDKMPEPIVIPPEPARDASSIERGRALYETEQCGQCHGPSGRGDGVSAHELKDDWGNPIVPFDLTSGHMKCGDEAASIYRVFMTGLNGTPMPAFSDSIKPADAWDLTHFIQSLSAAKETAR